MISSTRRGNRARGISNGSRVARPSAKVVDVLGDDAAALAPGAVDGRGALGLHADDADRRIDRAGDDPGAEHPAAAADRDEDDVDLGDGLEQFQRRGGDPGDQERLVRRVDVTQAVALGVLLGGQPGDVEVAAGPDDLGAHRERSPRP